MSRWDIKLSIKMGYISFKIETIKMGYIPFKIETVLTEHIFNLNKNKHQKNFNN